jgi:peptidyl-prolyl cis-trans isomerase B (cyclophilin B)
MLSTIAALVPLVLVGSPLQEGGAQDKKPLPSSEASADPALEAADAFIAEKKTAGVLDSSKPKWKQAMPFPPELTFDATKDYFWNLRTNKGDIKIRLMPDVAPMHVSSTIYLVRSGFYDDLVFHRVIPKFMAQGGCPLGVGTGNPGYKYDGETDPKVKHDRPGLLSMANAGPGTDGSQFFLTFVATPWLDGKHTVFGEVVQGMDVLKKLEALGSQRGRTKEKLEMQTSTITVAAKPAEPAKESAGEK